MSEIDLGEVTVSLAPVPDSSNTAPTSFRPAQFQQPEDARRHSSFQFLEPARLPGSFELVDTTVLTEPGQMAALTYIDKSRHKSLVLIQSPLGQQTRNDDGKPAMFTAGDSIRVATLGSFQAAVIDVMQDKSQRPGNETIVAWAKDGLFLQVSGSGMDQDELLGIAARI